MDFSAPSPVPADLSTFAETYLAEDAVLAGARVRAVEVGCAAPSVGCGATLALLAAAAQARAAVEVGTGTGVSALWILRGMRPDGVLTSIDVEPEHQGMARAVFRQAEVGPGRVRLINGRPLAVLPRLADASYDLFVAVDAAHLDYPDYLAEALRLLRPGGLVAFDAVLPDGTVPDPRARDPRSKALRQLVRAVRDHPGLLSAVLPTGGGLLTAVRCG